MGAGFLSSRCRNSLRSDRLMEIVWEEDDPLDPGHFLQFCCPCVMSQHCSLSLGCGVDTGDQPMWKAKVPRAFSFPLLADQVWELGPVLLIVFPYCLRTLDNDVLCIMRKWLITSNMSDVTPLLHSLWLEESIPKGTQAQEEASWEQKIS